MACKSHCFFSYLLRISAIQNTIKIPFFCVEENRLSKVLYIILPVMWKILYTTHNRACIFKSVCLVLPYHIKLWGMCYCFLFWTIAPFILLSCRLRDRVTVKTDSRHIVRETEDGTFVMTIKSAVRSDSGIYTCKIINEYGTKQCEGKLQVKGTLPFKCGTKDPSHIHLISVDNKSVSYYLPS